MEKRSIRKSIKKHFGRKSSQETFSSTATSQDYAPNNPFGANPSPATRRPVTEAPPPSYDEAVKPGNLNVPQVGRSQRSNSPSPSVNSNSSVLTMESVTRPEDKYAFLSAFDTVFVIDDSGSMAGSNWREVREVLQNITPICTDHDADGIDVYFLNHRSSQPALPKEGKPRGGYRNINSLERVNELFSRVRPTSWTPLGQTLQTILKPYTARYLEEAQKAEARGDSEVPVRPMNIIVITDGEASDEVESVIVNHAKKLDKADAPAYQVGIQFFQVGNGDEAREFLRRLDDELQEHGDGVRDMVDTMSWPASGNTRRVLTADDILKVVLGAVVKRLDRRRLSQDGGRPNDGRRGRY